MRKNDEFIDIVVDIGTNGEGVIKRDGTVVFVPFALLGEEIRYKILKTTSKCAYGKLLEVLKPSSIRVQAKCPVFGKCGGCQIQHIDYKEQLKIKEQNVVNTFKKVAAVDINILPAISGDSCFRYRNKLQLPVVQTQNGVMIGFYAENSHRVIPINDCLINAEWTVDVINAFNEYVSTYNIKGYNENQNSGDIREITVKEIKGNLIITVVSLKRTLKNSTELIEILKSKIKQNFSLYININAKSTNVIYGDEFRLLYGDPDYDGEMLGIKYKIGVQSFMQVNDSVCQKLYSSVKDLVDADENTVVIDAYSGAGLMTALLSREAKKAIGVEIIPEAVDCANQLAKANNLTDKISNYQGKCEEILPDIIMREKQKNSNVCLVLDPPRKGCDIKVINAILKSDIDKIVYVSCMPSTLARDVGLLIGTLEQKDGQIVKAQNVLNRYDIKYVRPFDMFAQTKHVETLICLQRRK